MTKKDYYNSVPFDARTYINGDVAIKPYAYLRNGLLHVRYTVDRCIQLSDSETEALKAKLSSDPVHKQDILMDTWNFQTKCVGKEVIHDGIAEIEKRMGKKNG